MRFLWLLVGAAAAPAPAVELPELTILQALRDRRVELDHRELELDQRARHLDELGRKLDARVADFNRKLLAIETRLNIGEPKRQAREKRLAALVETLQGLSAKKAAPMLATADPDLVGDVLLRLGTARTAALLAAMAPAQAGRLVNIVGEAQARALSRQEAERAERAAERPAEADMKAQEAAAAAPPPVAGGKEPTPQAGK